MSKPSLRAVLPRPRARSLYPAPALNFSTLHHAHFDVSGPAAHAGLPSGGRPAPGNPRPHSAPAQNGAQPPGDPFLKLQGDAPPADGPASPLLGPTPHQMAQHPQPPPTPPLQPPLAINPGPRLFPLPPPSSTFPGSIAAFPAMSYYQHILSSFPAAPIAAAPSKKARPVCSFESAAYGIPKHRPRLSPAPSSSQSSSFISSSPPAHLPSHLRNDHDPLHLSVQVGEDAYFLLPNALGVSDGVGGWAQRSRARTASPGGVSASALFSRRLMHLCADEIQALAPLPDTWPAPALPDAADRRHSPEHFEPLAVLGRAYARAVAMSRADRTTGGSGTALLAILLGDELRVAHLGDCALCLVRRGAIVFRSEEQQWRFNHPLQLGPSSSTLPSDAQRIVLPVEPDDVLILSSDGMSDNLWDEDVLDEVTKFAGAPAPDSAVAATIRRHAVPALLAEALCSRAKRASEHVRPADDGADEVPFARRAREEGHQFSGGKVDDISVLVAVIATPDAPPAGVKAAANLAFLTAWSAQ